MLERATARFWIWLAGVLLPIPALFMLTTVARDYDIGLMEIGGGFLAGLAVCATAVFTAKLSLPTKLALLFGTVLALAVPILILYAILPTLSRPSH